MALDETRSPRKFPPPLFWGWYIALGGAASNFLIIGIATFGFGVFINPMRDELGWSVAAISLGISLRSFEQGLLAPVTGVLVDRLGPQRMSRIGLLTLVLGLVIFSQARSLPVFYASSMVIALGQSTASFTPFSAVVMVWFRRMRGRAMGILNTGNGAGYLAAPALAYAVSTVGWRDALLLSAVVILVIGWPLTSLLADRPEDRGTGPDGDPLVAAAPGAPRLVTGATVRQALRTPAFWLLVFASTTNASQGAWIVHQIPHLENAGFSAQAAATIAGIYGAIQITLRFGIGWLGDSVGRKQMYAASFVLQGIGLIIFAHITSDQVWMVGLYFLVFAIGHAAWVVFMQTMVADYFGVLRFATLRGLTSMLQMPVGVGAPVFAGWMFDRNGDYVAVFTIFGFMAMLGAVFVLLIRRPTWTDVMEPLPGSQLAATEASPPGVHR